jgi:hypothetical protein
LDGSIGEALVAESCLPGIREAEEVTVRRRKPVQAEPSQGIDQGGGKPGRLSDRSEVLEPGAVHDLSGEGFGCESGERTESTRGEGFGREGRYQLPERVAVKSDVGGGERTGDLVSGGTLHRDDQDVVGGGVPAEEIVGSGVEGGVLHYKRLRVNFASSLPW